MSFPGGSYGGYAALVGLTFTPDTFACGIDIFGPSNLISLLEAVPPYWLGFYQDLVKMVGADIDTEAGKQSLKARSPLFFADRVKKPIMIHQGANDPRVKQQESGRQLAATKEKDGNFRPIRHRSAEEPDPSDLRRVPR